MSTCWCRIRCRFESFLPPVQCLLCTMINFRATTSHPTACTTGIILDDPILDCRLLSIRLQALLHA
jgi:hypothetical protein